MPFKVGQNLCLEMVSETWVTLVTKLLCEKDMVIQNTTKTLTMEDWRESWLGCPLETQIYTEKLTKISMAYGFHAKKNMLAFTCLRLQGLILKEGRPDPLRPSEVLLIISMGTGFNL